MGSEKFIPLILALVVGAILVGPVFVPLATSSTTRTIETEEIINEGGEWLKLGYAEGNSINFGSIIGTAGDDLTIGTQTGVDEDLIIYADDEVSIVRYADTLYLITPDRIVNLGNGGDLSIQVTDGVGSVIVHGIPIYSLTPSWAYYPDANGIYGVFYDAGLSLEEDKPTVAIGIYANAYAYNDRIIDLNGAVLNMEMVGDYSTEAVTWERATNTEDLQTTLPISHLDPGVITPIDTELQPIDLGGGSDVIIQSADPTNGTRVGDLYYTFSGANATVIGYSSSINWATFTTIPDTVESDGVTYTVTAIGDYAFTNCTNLALTSLPEGITSIGSNAFTYCTNLALTSLPEGVTTLKYGCFQDCPNLALTSLPEGITTLPSICFQNCTNLALTSLPEGITSIGAACFYHCTNLALTSLPEGITSIGVNAFNGCTNLESIIIQSSPTIDNTSFSNTSILEVLNLGSNPITVNSYGLNAESVQDYIGAIGYIAPMSFMGYETVQVGGATGIMIQLLPLVAGVGLLLVAVGVMIYNRF